MSIANCRGILIHLRNTVKPSYNNIAKTTEIAIMSDQ